MGMHHIVVHGPLEDREPAVLRRDERDRSALIVNELRGGEMPGAAELRGRQHRALRAFDRFGHDDGSTCGSASPARDFRAECQEHFLVDC